MRCHPIHPPADPFTCPLPTSMRCTRCLVVRRIPTGVQQCKAEAGAIRQKWANLRELPTTEASAGCEAALGCTGLGWHGPGRPLVQRHQQCAGHLCAP